MKIETGYKPGIIGAVTEMHARYYDNHSGFGAEFETKVATELSEFVTRLEIPGNQIWHVVKADKIAASVTIDGQDLGGNVAHLRWFIADDTMRGTGVGSALMTRVAEHLEAHSFSSCTLWTFKGLDAARHLYEKFGFVLVEEKAGRQWGSVVTEQQFSRTT